MISALESGGEYLSSEYLAVSADVRFAGLQVSPIKIWKVSGPGPLAATVGRIHTPSMNTAPLQPLRLPGFKVVPKRNLRRFFSPRQNGYYILLGRRGPAHALRERVLFVHYLDHFLETCQRQIEKLRARHGVLITHVAVKAGRHLRPAHHDLAELYARAVTVHNLREKLQPRFRRL